MEGSRSIYIIGAQCTGKTTLVEDVAVALQSHGAKPVTTIKELARGILNTANITRDDIRAGNAGAMEFQKLVLGAQLNEELDRERRGLIVSDRSGIDPIAYATLYGPPEVARELLESDAWRVLREKMRKGLIVLCEPVPEWLFDDGTRLMPADDAEWYELHTVFISLLQQTGITYEVLPATCTSREERVARVLERWRSK
ncbi:P-loop containing nucleoside triphosphate hydrolase [Cladophialophora carrionii]|uniref:p-loop containing nucleoside triphosphate hydrolase n=1 Tax=Cladophialophora carrionii TaxID=86049 RepID=A0A1C1CXZ5_9EURO|nr:P-loop containing nucleoside triphosphate hydrolase [Cladophialophora carrionii]